MTHFLIFRSSIGLPDPSLPRAVFLPKLSSLKPELMPEEPEPQEHPLVPFHDPESPGVSLPPVTRIDVDAISRQHWLKYRAYKRRQLRISLLLFFATLLSTFLVG
jgi:hypothetical protein